MSALEIVYTIVALVVVRPIAGHYAWVQSDALGQERPDGVDWTCGALIGLLWPLVLVRLLVVLTLRSLSLAMPKIGRERAAMRRIEAERLREMERDVGLDDPR